MFSCDKNNLLSLKPEKLLQIIRPVLQKHADKNALLLFSASVVCLFCLGFWGVGVWFCFFGCGLVFFFLNICI